MSSYNRNKTQKRGEAMTDMMQCPEYHTVFHVEERDPGNVDVDLVGTTHGFVLKTNGFPHTVELQICS
jgi:hypothetical protein